MPSQPKPPLAGKKSLPANKRSGITLLVLYCALGAGLVHGQSPISWKTGSALEKARQAPLGVNWSERELREGLRTLGEPYGVAIWLDRRLDPNARVSVQFNQVPLEAALQLLAEQRTSDVVRLGPLLLFVPKQAAARWLALDTLHKRDLLPLSPAQRQAWQAEQQLSWPEATEPRQLFEQLLAAVGATCENPQALPHDLWPAWEGPPLSRVEWFTLLLGSFDLTFERTRDGNRLRLVPLPQPLTYDHVYRVSGDIVATGKAIKQMYPELTLRREETTRIGVTANAEQHYAIAKLLQSQRKPSPPEPRRPVAAPQVTRYSLTVTNEPGRKVLATLAASLRVKLVAGPDVAAALDKRVSLREVNAPLEKLLHLVLDPVKLRYELDEQELRVFLGE